MTTTVRSDARRSIEKITVAAVELFAEQGLDCPLEEIARRAGVSPGTIYHRFGGRAGLVDAVAPQVAAEKVSAVIDAAEGEETAWGRFTAYVEGLSMLGSSDAVLREALTGCSEPTPSVHEVCRQGLERGFRLIEEARRDGALRADFGPDDLHPLLLSMIGVAHAAPEARSRMLGFTLDGLRGQRRE
ncbi:TetR/AcrR family transcriptional regulator [Streptomyces sp. NPDC017202]|uniref:TetR/AcrR family transcriptional regulator n=1 Tax=Streptomyces sp. NPDC017202 TaxID=3364981 RepID=UPI00379E26A4